MLILAGVVEFGHLMYVRHTLTNASREGARAAVVYTGATGDRSTDAEKLATDAVKKYMQDTDTLNTIGACKTKVTFPTGGTTGKPVTVMVTASGGLLMLDNFITSLSNITVSAETTMRLE
jgi:Flp pilus assembly protein TadG